MKITGPARVPDSGRRPAWKRITKACAVAAAILAAAVCQPQLAGQLTAAALTSSGRPVIYYYDAAGTNVLKRTAVDFDDDIEIPKINSSWLPEDLRGKEDNVPCWMVRSTGDVFYPGDIMWLDGYMDEDSLTDMEMVLVPNDKTLIPDDGSRTVVYFYDIEGENVLTHRIGSYDRELMIPAIEKEWLPEETRNNEEIYPCWAIRDTDEAYYPEDSLWLEDYMEEDEAFDIVFDLVPDDKLLDYDKTDIYFYDSEWEEIERYTQTDIKVGRTIKLPDPKPYGGSYWAYEDEDGNRKLAKGGDDYRVTSDYIDFQACGNETISIVYRYPVDVPYLVNGYEPGDIYWETNAHVGDYITIQTSPGNVVWGCTFQGWEDYSGQYDDFLQPGRSIQIVYPEDLEFVAYYEEDENWDPDAPEGTPDENGTLMRPDGLTTEYTQQLQENAGAGVNVTLSNNPTNESFGGTITKSGGTFTHFTQTDTKKSATNGNITSTTKVDKTLTHETEDIYGRPMAKDGDATKPLIQDDSMFAMDIYGNAFAYPYWASSEEERIEIVTNRLEQYKGNSWLNFINSHSELAEAVSRFEAREFELLKDSCNDKLKFDRRSWRGWMDYYSDIPATIGNSEVNNIDGETNRLLARVKASTSWDNITFYPYYYDPSVGAYSMYGFDGLTMLSEAQKNNLVIIYNTLIRAGYSEASACGVCAYVWEQTGGTFSPSYSENGKSGIGGWNEDDLHYLKGIAQDTAEDWDDVGTQAECLVVWLNQHMSDINDLLKSNTGMIVKELKKLSTESGASDVLCAAFMEGKDTKTGDEILLFNGKYYDEAKSMRENAKKLKKALQKNADGSYNFDLSSLNLGDVSELRRRVVEIACQQVGKPYNYGSKGPNEFDCSGLTAYAYRLGAGIELSAKSTAQAEDGRKIPASMLRPGDLICYDGHVAMYIGNGKRVEAVGKAYGVQIRDWNATSSKKFLGYVSILD